MPFAAASIQSIPSLTTEQMREVDRAMIEDFGISLVRMMENAGRNLAELTRLKLGGSVEYQTIVVLAGQGNNGGGGMVAARHLSNWGARVTVVLSRPPTEHKTVAHEQLEILRRMGVDILPGEASGKTLDHANLILDALIGYGLVGPPRGITANLIRAANTSHQTIVALDAPSGLDTSSGEIFEPCIRANATLTLALPKTGLAKPQARIVVGELFLADIGVPPRVYADMGIRVPNLFEKASLVRVIE